MNFETHSFTLWGCLLSVLFIHSGCSERHTGNTPGRSERAWAWFQQNEYNAALREFSALEEEVSPGSSLHQEVLYAQANIWHVRPNPRKDLALAETLYREALALQPDSELAPWILLGSARTRVLPQGGEPLPVEVRVAAYEELVGRFPRHPAGEEAFLLQQAALLESGTPQAFQNVQEALLDFIRDHGESPWISHAWMLVSSSAERLGDAELRLEAMLRAEETQETDPLGSRQDKSEIYWRIATTAQYDLGNFEVAREYYHRFIEQYPTQQRVFPARQALKQMEQTEKRLREELRTRSSGEPSPEEAKR